MASPRLASDAALLRSAVSGLQRRLRAQDENGGIAPTSLGILARLLRVGVSSATEIAQLEHLQPQSLTRSLQSLEEAGLIDRWIDEDDRRRTSIAITDKGETLLRGTIRKRVAWLARVMESRLSPDERDTLRAAAVLMERMTGGSDAVARPSDNVFNLIPSVHVADVERSLEFYARLGFVEDGRWEDEGLLVWASMHARTVRAARIMFSLAEAPVEPRAQGIHFYCWTADIVALRQRLIGDGLAPGPIEHPEHMEDGEFHLDDPDAYHVIVGQIRRRR
jgi:DNA-binding MarR family transcriptional regulator